MTPAVFYEEEDTCVSFVIWMCTCRGPTKTMATYTALYYWHSFFTTDTVCTCPWLPRPHENTCMCVCVCCVSVYIVYIVLCVCVCVCVYIYILYLCIYIIIRIHSIQRTAPRADTAVVCPTSEEEDTCVSYEEEYTYRPACRHCCRVTVAAGGHDDGHSV